MAIKWLQSASMGNEYQESIDYLYGFVNFEHRQINQYSPDNISLDRPRELLQFLGNPQHAFRSIHIAGTKGKGSVGAMVTASLRGAGYRVGLYTSPHLQDFRDRIRILTPEDSDGRITPEHVVRSVQALKPAVNRLEHLTWYELITAMAFQHFAWEGVDVAVVEVGLGGRLDATNVINPLVSVITSLSLDHTYLLGDTLAEIAREKGGIIKPNVPVVAAPQSPEAMEQLISIAGDLDSPFTIVGREWQFEPIRRSAEPGDEGIKTSQTIVITASDGSTLIPVQSELVLGLVGQHQQVNAVVALATLDTVSSLFPMLDYEAVRMGLETVEWLGRLQVVDHGPGIPTLLADCAHNVDSADKLAIALTQDFDYENLWLVIGVTVDKDLSGILNALHPLTNQIIVTASSHPRAAQPGVLLRLAQDMGYEAIGSNSVDEAVIMAWQLAGEDDLICITGSIFVVGDLLNHWESLQSELAKQDQALSGSRMSGREG